MGGRQETDWRQETKVWAFMYLFLPCRAWVGTGCVLLQGHRSCRIDLPYGSSAATVSALAATFSGFWSFFPFFLRLSLLSALLPPIDFHSPIYTSLNNPLISPQLLISYPEWYIYHVPPSWGAYWVTLNPTLDSCIYVLHRVFSWLYKWDLKPQLLLSSQYWTCEHSSSICKGEFQLLVKSPMQASNATSNLAQQIENALF